MTTDDNSIGSLSTMSNGSSKSNGSYKSNGSHNPKSHRSPKKSLSPKSQASPKRNMSPKRSFHLEKDESVALTNDNITALFRKYDKDRNGYLSIVEVEDLIKSECKKVSLFRGVPKRVRRMAFTFSLRNSYFERLGPKEFHKFCTNYLPLCKVLNSVFKDVDDDGSGKIDFREFSRGLQMLGLEKRHHYHSSEDQPSTYALFKSIDTNYSGKITFDEWANYFKNHSLSQLQFYQLLEQSMEEEEADTLEVPEARRKEQVPRLETITTTSSYKTPFFHTPTKLPPSIPEEPPVLRFQTPNSAKSFVSARLTPPFLTPAQFSPRLTKRVESPLKAQQLLRDDAVPVSSSSPVCARRMARRALFYIANQHINTYGRYLRNERNIRKLKKRDSGEEEKSNNGIALLRNEVLSKTSSLARKSLTLK